MTTPSDEALSFLNGFPKGTRGYYEDAEIINALVLLCERYGYGRVPQLANWIEDLWHHPEKVEQYRRMHEERMKLMKETMAYYAANPLVV